MTPRSAALIALLLIAGPAFSAPAEPALPFDTAAVRYQEVVRIDTFNATIEAVNRSTVSAQTSGQVIEVYFDVDDYVPKDTVLLRLKDTEQRAALNQARAALEEARARRAEAKEQFERFDRLFDKDAVSRSEMDRMRTELDAARARVESAEAGLRQAEEQLAYTVVRAPYSGIVVSRHVEAGETVNPGDPLMTGFSLEQLRAVTEVPQNLIGNIREESRARVLIPGEERRELPATRLTFTPYADERTHTFRVRVDLPPGELAIYPGSFVKVGFITGRDQALLVPAEAVAFRSEVRAVYVVDDNGAIGFRQIRIGRNLGPHMEVLAGLEAGEEVALDPVRAATYLKERRARAAGEPAE